MLPLYYLGLFLLGVLGRYTGLKYARSTKTAEDVLVYSLVTGILAMGVFYVLSGFDLHFNCRTLIYALLFGLLVFSGYFISIYSYRVMTVAAINFIPSGIRLIIVPIIGVVVFAETFSTIALVQTVLVLLMLLTLFVSSKKQDTSVAGSSVGIKLLLLAAAVVQSTLISTIYNAFANDPSVCDSHSFFFLTNVITVAISTVCLLAISRCRPRQLLSEFKAIPPIGYWMIFLSVLSSNIASLLDILILREGSLILYTPLSGALGLLAGEFAAVFIAKEKPQILATILAISSVLVVILF